MSGPLVPQVYTAEVREAHARQRGIEAQLVRQQQKKHHERVQQLAQRMRHRLDMRAAGSEARS